MENKQQAMQAEIEEENLGVEASLKEIDNEIEAIRERLKRLAVKRMDVLIDNKRAIREIKEKYGEA